MVLGIKIRNSVDNILAGAVCSSEGIMSKDLTSILLFGWVIEQNITCTVQYFNYSRRRNLDVDVGESEYINVKHCSNMIVSI